MSKFTKQVELFLSINGFDNRELAEAIIEQLGGEKVFLENHEAIAHKGTSGNHNGFIFREQVIPFYTTHKEAILAIAKNEADLTGSYTVIELIESHLCDEGFDMDEIAKGLYDPLDDLENISQEAMRVTYFLSCLMPQILCQNFLCFMVEQEA